MALEEEKEHVVKLQAPKPKRGGRDHSENHSGEVGHRPWLPKLAPFPSSPRPGKEGLTHRPGVQVIKGQPGRAEKERLPNRGPATPNKGVLLTESQQTL